MSSLKSQANSVEISTVEMHTGGEPVRIITAGYPKIQGKTILEKFCYVRSNLDYLRKVLLLEPRGHFDMFGALLVEPDAEEAHLAVIFMHNQGYGTMCGHAVMALSRYAVDSGMVSVDITSGEVPVNIQCPCGVVKVCVEINDGKTGRVRFTSVPAFVFALDVVLETKELGPVTVDIVYGGVFYALIEDQALGFRLHSSDIQDIVQAESVIRKAAKDQVRLHHPDSSDLAFVYGTIVYSEEKKSDIKNDLENVSTNMCIFAENQVDRSPCGSGTTARMAAKYARGELGLNEPRVFKSLTGSAFGGQIVKETKCGEFDAIHVEVTGKAFYTGKCTFTMENDDRLRHGFIFPPKQD